jgi:hypothetical protein
MRTLYEHHSIYNRGLQAAKPPRMVEVRSKHGRGGSYRRDMFRNYLDGRIERTTS